MPIQYMWRVKSHHAFLKWSLATQLSFCLHRCLCGLPPPKVWMKIIIVRTKIQYSHRQSAQDETTLNQPTRLIRQIENRVQFIPLANSMNIAPSIFSVWAWVYGSHSNVYRVCVWRIRDLCVRCKNATGIWQKKKNIYSQTCLDVRCLMGWVLCMLNAVHCVFRWNI